MSVSTPDVNPAETDAVANQNQPDQPALPDASDLEDKMPMWFRSSWLLVLFVVFGGLLFFYFGALLKVSCGNIWGDLSYGEMIWKTKSVPTAEAFMPLAEGMEMTDGSWLSQVAVYHLYMWQKAPALQFFHGTCIAIVVGLLIGLTFRRSHNATCTLVGIVLFMWICWYPLQIVQMQLVGLCCFMLLWGLLQVRHWKTWHYVSLFVLFVGWVNLHESFVIGLTILAICCVGSLIDLLRRTNSVRSAFTGSSFRRYLSMFQLAVLATLLNPYGLRIYSGVISMIRSDNLQDLLPWEALTLRSPQGQAVAFMALLLMIVYRMTPRRVSTIEVLQLVVLGAAALWMAHMTLWWAAVAAYYFILHASAIWKKSQQQNETTAAIPRERKSLWTVMSIGLAFLFIALTPFGTSLLHGTGKKKRNNLSRQTPIMAVNTLLDDKDKGKLPSGQIFNTHEWGDYIVWQGGKDQLPVFTASRAHLVPREVWLNYHQIVNMGGDWRELLDRYGVNVVIIDKQRHRNMGESLKRRKEEWDNIFEDNVSMLLYRKKPL